MATSILVIASERQLRTGLLALPAEPLVHVCGLGKASSASCAFCNRGGQWNAGCLAPTLLACALGPQTMYTPRQIAYL